MPTNYRLLTYRAGAGPRPGVLVDTHIYAAADLFGERKTAIDTSSMLGLLQSWETVSELLPAALKEITPDKAISLGEVTLEAPILYPGVVLATGGNYSDHLDEMARKHNRPPISKYRLAEPFFTMKTAAHSIIGHGAPIRYPQFSKQLDYEAEIGVVIGRYAENVAESDAMDAVAGYVIINDLSARDYVRREILPDQKAHDWFGQKCFRDSMPMGPWITPKQFVPDPYDLSIKLWVNDELRQNGSSKSMIYPLAEQIAYLSRRITLRPGDVISTGCPSGVGMALDTYLKPGDRIRIEVQHCGVLDNTVVAG